MRVTVGYLNYNSNKSTFAVFISLSGAFKGNLLSGVLFPLTLTGTLVHLHAILERLNPQISPSCMPLES